MWYRPFQLVCNFPCCAGRTTSCNTKSPCFISLHLNLELYLLAALCLAANSRTWETYLNSSIGSAAYFNTVFFASSFNWTVSMKEYQYPPVTWHLLHIPWRTKFPFWWSVGWGGMTTVSRWVILPLSPWHHRAFSWVLQNYFIRWFYLSISLWVYDKYKIFQYSQISAKVNDRRIGELSSIVEDDISRKYVPAYNFLSKWRSLLIGILETSSAFIHLVNN